MYFFVLLLPLLPLLLLLRLLFLFRISQILFLFFAAPFSKIAESGNDIVVNAGSTINLTCIISRSPNRPAHVFWYYNDGIINYDQDFKSRGKIELRKDPVKQNTFISQLILRDARYNDSGNYSCFPVNVEPSSIYVHVLQGKHKLFISSRLRASKPLVVLRLPHSALT